MVGTVDKILETKSLEQKDEPHKEYDHLSFSLVELSLGSPFRAHFSPKPIDRGYVHPGKILVQSQVQESGRVKQLSCLCEGWGKQFLDVLGDGD